MKNAVVYWIAFMVILSNCNVSVNNRLTQKTLIENGYRRENGDNFMYISRFTDTLEDRYYLNYELKYAKKRVSPSFFSYPSIKDSIAFLIAFEQLDGRNGKVSCIDSIDVYINKQIWRSGLYPLAP
jgi:hypothetical protein